MKVKREGLEVEGFTWVQGRQVDGGEESTKTEYVRIYHRETLYSVS